MKHIRNGRLLLTALVLLMTMLLLLLPEGQARQIPAFLLLWVMPALAWTLWGEFSSGMDGVGLLERFIVGAGLALLVQALLALLISYLPGPPPRWLMLGTAVLVTLFPLWQEKIFKGNQPETLTSKTNGSAAGIKSAVPWLLIGIMLLALLLRLVNLDYKELQGDEGIIMVRAAAVLTGDEQQLFLHQKGPIEILLPLTTWGLTGAINEFWARLPFAWAGVLGVGLVYVLGRCWNGQKSSLAAALLFAICGFGIAFSRIIQYQTLVMLWGGLSLLSAFRFRASGKRSDLMLTAAFLAGGLLAHYDAVLVGPAVLWLLWTRLRQEGGVDWRPWLTAGLLGFVILALFYLPFVMNPNFERTFSYLLQGRVGTDESGLPFGWSGTAVWQMVTFYNSLWYILGLTALGVVGLWRLIRGRDHLALALYFLVPLAFYTLIVGDPRTHVYTIFPGAVLLAGLAVGWWAEVRPFASTAANERLQWAGRLLFALWLGISTVYVVLLFVQVSPERQRTWDENRPLPFLFPTTWDEPPLYGLFGFPHQAGWRVAGGLLPAEGLPYASNEEEEITNYYMAQAPRTHCLDFESFLLVSDVQDEIPYEPDWLEGYFLQQEVAVEGQVSMQIYGRRELSEPVVVAADNHSLWVTPEQVRPPVSRGAVPVEVNLANQVVLAGYDVSSTAVSAGDRLIVRLYWEVLAPFERNKQVFVHLSNGGVAAQGDSAPECAVNPTPRWEPGQIIVDPHIIEIPAGIEVETLELIVGMYDLLDESRLQRKDGLGDSVYLTDISVP